MMGRLLLGRRYIIVSSTFVHFCFIEVSVLSVFLCHFLLFFMRV